MRSASSRAELRLQRARSQGDAQGAHGGAGCGREHVDGLEGLRALVPVDLGQVHLSDRAGYMDRCRGALKPERRRGAAAWTKKYGASVRSALVPVRPTVARASCAGSVPSARAVA